MENDDLKSLDSGSSTFENMDFFAFLPEMASAGTSRYTFSGNGATTTTNDSNAQAETFSHAEGSFFNLENVSIDTSAHPETNDVTNRRQSNNSTRYNEIDEFLNFNFMGEESIKLEVEDGTRFLSGHATLSNWELETPDISVANQEAQSHLVQSDTSNGNTQDDVANSPVAAPSPSSTANFFELTSQQPSGEASAGPSIPNAHGANQTTFVFLQPNPWGQYVPTAVDASQLATLPGVNGQPMPTYFYHSNVSQSSQPRPMMLQGPMASHPAGTYYQMVTGPISNVETSYSPSRQQPYQFTPSATATATMSQAEASTSVADFSTTTSTSQNQQQHVENEESSSSAADDFLNHLEEATRHKVNGTYTSTGEKIRRPPNAFMIFAKSRRREILYNNRSLTNKDVSRMLGREWHDLTQEKRNDFNQQASDLRLEHQTKYPGKWRAGRYPQPND